MKFSVFQNHVETSPEAPAGQPDGPHPGDHFEAEFQKLKTRIHRELIDSLDLSRIGTLDEPRLRTHIRNLAEGLLRSRPEMLSSIDEERLIDELMAESFGLGPLEPYMQDPDVTDILVTGPARSTWSAWAGSRRPTPSSPTKST